jgi:RNA polymerase sigma factor (sigma-70 family)
MNGLDDIVATYGASLTRIAASYEADAALREDLFQEILLAVHRALPRLRKTERIAPYVFRIAHNRGVSHVVSRTTAKRRAIVSEPSGEAATPEEGLIQSERQARLLGAVRKLPLPYRQVITLVLEDLSHAEIADALQISPSNVGVRVNRAKKMLKEMLDER